MVAEAVAVAVMMRRDRYLLPDWVRDGLGFHARNDFANPRFDAGRDAANPVFDTGCQCYTNKTCTPSKTIPIISSACP